MRFLFVVKQKKNVDTFERVIAALLAEGHGVTLAIQERDPDRDRRLAGQFDHPQFELATCPESRGDAWRASAPLVRAAGDWAQYSRPAYREASKLRQRAVDRLTKELGAEGEFAGDRVMVHGPAAGRLRDTLARTERAIPSDPLHEEFIARHRPDVVLVTPGVHFGSAQTDIVKSARALGIPVWMLLFSWDNLSTKGALHAAPDLMFVWNERQRREAAELHDFPAERVVVVGAPRFDEFFTLKSVVRREDFFRPLGLDRGRRTLLYVCSSRFIAEDELSFIRTWLLGVRAASGALGNCNVIVRPHPDVVLVDDGREPETVTWPNMPRAVGWIQRPFDDPAAIVLRTTYRTQQAFYECLHHADAIVGLNTSAELEAGIAGRPVFTVLAADASADGQAQTLHFNYLLREQGGFVTYAPDLATHLEQVGQALESPPDAGTIRSFIMAFLRPCGDVPVAPAMARRLVETFTARAGAHAALADEDAPLRGVASDDAVTAADETGKVLRLGEPGSAARVYATPETRRWRRRGVYLLDPAVVGWLTEQLHPGDVIYDVGAGIGAYSIFAATQRGALAVAFEPGFAAFKRLCDNLLLNVCYRSVVPLPIALGDRHGLLELEYPFAPGGDQHSLRARQWRPRRDAIEAQYRQPVCAERLDDAVARYKLPGPSVIRIAARSGADAIVAGAGRLLRDPRLRSVLVLVATPAEAEALVPRFQVHGFSAAIGAPDGDRGVAIALSRAPLKPPARAVAALRRAASRIRGNATR